MIRREALKRLGTKQRNCEVTPQALRPIAKSLMKRDGQKAPTAVHGPIGTTYHPDEKINAFADCLENQLTSHTCVMKTFSDWWRLQSKLCSLLKATPCWEKQDPVTYIEIDKEL
jgi:hypothetical protein